MCEKIIIKLNSKRIGRDIMAKDNQLGSEKINVLLRRFATPSIIAMMVGALYNIIDQFFIGNYIGMYGNAATNVALPFTTICMSWALMSGLGGASGFNLNLGAGKKDIAARYMGTALLMLTGGGIVLAVLVMLFLEPLLLFCGATPEVMPYARSFTSISCFGFPLLVFSTGASHLIRADGSPRYAMFTALSGAVLNCFLNPLFISVLDFGIAGSAMATVTGQAVASFLAIWYFCCRLQSVSLTQDCFKLSLSRMAHVMGLGSSNCINQLGMMVVQITLNNTLTYYGAQSVYGSDIPLAVVGIITKVNMIFFSVIIGISQGMQPIASFNYGAGNYVRVVAVLKLALKTGACISLFSFICFQCFARELAGIFGEGSEVYFQFAEEYFHIYLFGTLYNFLQPIISNFFSAIGKAQKGVLLSLTRQVIFLLPLIVLLPRFYGIDGVMYAGVAADTCAGLLALWLAYRQGRFLLDKTGR